MNLENSEVAIRTIIEARSCALRARDVDGMMADVADDVVNYDVVDPLRRQGFSSSRERAAAWVSTFDGEVSLEIRDLRLEVDGDVAFSSGLSHVTGKQKTGTELDMWFRTTLGFRRNAGRWLIVHEHDSVPFNPETGQPSIGLKP